MQNRTPVAAADRPALPDFTPVPRQKVRHDGWTPERQRAFIEALADTGSVSRAAAQVNMAQTNCYTLRRAPGAEEFRRAWDAALDFGLARLKDVAFERAIEGELVPVFVGGKLMGFQRKFNNALLMFCLRHYGQDAAGKRTTINYFSSKAVSGAAAGAGDGTAGAGATAEASTTTVRTVITGNGDGSAATPALRDDRAAATLEGFAGVPLDEAATAAIEQALADCAARARAAEAAVDAGGTAALHALADDPGEPFVRVGDCDPYLGTFEPVVSYDDDEDEDAFAPDEPDWRQIGAEPPVPPPSPSAET